MSDYGPGPSVAPRRRPAAHLNHYGPWVIGGGAVLAAVIYVVVRHHVISRDSLLFFIVLVPSIILHEVSHGVVANWCGDDTAKRAGRLSLNPLRHIDPIGTILLPLILIVTVGRAFGWAKPVPVDVSRLRHPRNQSVLVSLAGPATNILLALAAGFALRFATHDLSSVVVYGQPDHWPVGYDLLWVFGEANAIIAAFNLIPIPPLDGSALLERLLPASLLPGYYRIRSAMILAVFLFVFVFQGAITWLLNEAITGWFNVVFN
ncbi:MAG: peptidase [Acidimicrobiaceae bacterium]|nr:peptidase [Acidimicrobiaceae bacterium]